MSTMEPRTRRPRGSLPTAIVVGCFGLLTLAASAAVLFNVAGAASQAGQVVPLVLWTNLLASTLYIAAALALIRRLTWAPWPLLGALLLLLVAAFGFFLHVQHGLPYEQRTIGALSFRIFVTALFYAVVRHFSKPV